MQIYLIAFLLLCQSITSCQRVDEKSLPANTNLYFISLHGADAGSKTTETVAANIIFQSMDGGETWQDISAGLPVDFSANCILAEAGNLVLGSDLGLFKSRLATATPNWDKSFYLKNRVTNLFRGRAGVFAANFEEGFFQEMGSSGVWLPLHTGLSDKSVHAVLEMPDGALFVGTEFGIFKSTDGTKTWKQVFAEGGVYSIAAAGNVMVSAGQKGILRSSDGGENWTYCLKDGGMGIETGLVDGGFSAINYNGSSRRLRVSTDGGQTWLDRDAGLLPSKSIADVEQMGKFLFCCTEAGVFRSTDQGKTWELVLRENGKGGFRLSVSGNVVYAVTGISGC